MRVGIIVATNQELIETKKLIENVKEKVFYNLQFFIGVMHLHEVILVKSGIGKVNAARTTQIMIDQFQVDRIINIGAAGAINPELNINDIVIGNKLVQYDFDTSSLGKTEKGEIDGVGKFFYSDDKLINLCNKILKNNDEKTFDVKIGIIASADLFCSDLEKAKQIRNEFGAECVEMEGAAIAQVCFLDKIPFLIIRGISDTSNGNNKIDYYTYCNIAAKQAAKLLDDLLKNS